MANSIDQTLQFINRQDEENITQKLATRFKLPYVNLVNYPIVSDILHIVPEDIAEKYNLVSYLRAGKIIKVAITKPDNTEIFKIIADLKRSTELDFVLAVCSESSYRYAMHLYKLYPSKAITSEKVEITEAQEQEYKAEIQNLVDLKEKIKKVSATNLMDVIFAGAVAVNASDVHLEPEETDLKIRYRIDGVLQTVAELPLSAHKILVSRIKYLAKLKLDINNQPQDGRFEVTAAGKPFDIRVSTLPSAYGETVVMRLLSREGKFISLEQLGFSPDGIKTIHNAIAKPNGIIFNTGPTGSGKTTTLYAILTELNKPGVKIITLEDPIEYRIKGINQSQVEQEKGYTFASGLRSILRQDPDIIMVGEIRDKETGKSPSMRP
jgi:type IV pilus assembly protein PilB